MTTNDNAPVARDPADVVLYLGAALVLGVGISWLVLAQPWQRFTNDDTGTENAAMLAPPASPDVSQLSTHEPTVEETLRMADVAVSAGMLIEPERYSAWALYSDVLRVDPNNVDARESLREVADTLLTRATTAFEQGRARDARDLLALVQRQFPDHAGAAVLAERIDASEDIQRRQAVNDLTPPSIGAGSEPLTGPALNLTEPVEATRSAFDTALAAGNLLQPAEASASYFLRVMAERDADHTLTTDARRDLVEAILARAAQSTEALDAAATEAWIDAARALGADSTRLEDAGAALTAALVTAESQRLRPAAELTVENYTPPRYPPAAERARTAGWVDVEFIVTTSGATRDVRVTGASHETLFRREAIAAVETWSFEPRTYLGRPIEQSAYMRIRFELQ